MYIPKSRIKPNLYTSGAEFMILATSEEYIGFYHSLYTGKFYTGKDQNATNIREIVPFEVPSGKGTSDIPPNLTPELNVIALFLEDPDPIINEDEWNQGDIVRYLELKGKNPLDDDPRELPINYFPKPTDEDYQLGVFTRYFAKKINELKYTEIDEKTYKKFKKKSSKYVWELYNCFELQWTLTGKKEDVALANRNQVLIAEQKNKIIGLGQFIQNDYLKFYDSKVKSYTPSPPSLDT